jgi:hypothetical protein
MQSVHFLCLYFCLSTVFAPAKIFGIFITVCGLKLPSVQFPKFNICPSTVFAPLKHLSLFTVRLCNLYLGHFHHSLWSLFEEKIQSVHFHHSLWFQFGVNRGKITICAFSCTVFAPAKLLGLFSGRLRNLRGIMWVSLQNINAENKRTFPLRNEPTRRGLYHYMRALFLRHVELKTCS